MSHKVQFRSKEVKAAFSTILSSLHDPQLLSEERFVLFCDDGSLDATTYGIKIEDSDPIDLFPMPFPLPEGSEARSAIVTRMETALAIRDFLQAITNNAELSAFRPTT